MSSTTGLHPDQNPLPWQESCSEFPDNDATVQNMHPCYYGGYSHDGRRREGTVVLGLLACYQQEASIRIPFPDFYPK